MTENEKKYDANLWVDKDTKKVFLELQELFSKEKGIVFTQDEFVRYCLKRTVEEESSKELKTASFKLIEAFDAKKKIMED